MKASFYAALLVAQALPCLAEIRTVEYEGIRYVIKQVDPQRTTLRLFLNSKAGDPYRRFDRINSDLAENRLQLDWAMNAGMYHGSLKPVGLCMIDGKEIAPLNRAEGEGNFFRKPNGVFALAGSRAAVLTTDEYAASGLKPELATQSGPMLVIHGSINAKLPDSYELLRNAVGVDASGKVYFVISETPVRLIPLAQFFRDHLKCSNALYLDGTVSSFYSRELKRNDFRMDLGPVIGEVVPGGN